MTYTELYKKIGKQPLSVTKQKVYVVVEGKVVALEWNMFTALRATNVYLNCNDKSAIM